MISEETVKQKEDLLLELNTKFAATIGKDARLSEVGIMSDTATGKRRALLRLAIAANKIAAFAKGQLADNPDEITDFTLAKINDASHQVISAASHVQLAYAGNTDSQIDEQVQAQEKILDRLKGMLGCREEVSLAKKKLIDELLNKKVASEQDSV